MLSLMSLHRHVTATLSPCFPLGSTLHVMHSMCLDKRMMKHFHQYGSDEKKNRFIVQ